MKKLILGLSLLGSISAFAEAMDNEGVIVTYLMCKGVQIENIGNGAVKYEKHIVALNSEGDVMFDKKIDDEYFYERNACENSLSAIKIVRGMGSVEETY